MDKNNISIGLDIGTTKIVAMVGEKNKFNKVSLLSLATLCITFVLILLSDIDNFNSNKIFVNNVFTNVAKLFICEHCGLFAIDKSKERSLSLSLYIYNWLSGTGALAQTSPLLSGRNSLPLPALPNAAPTRAHRRPRTAVDIEDTPSGRP